MSIFKLPPKVGGDAGGGMMGGMVGQLVDGLLKRFNLTPGEVVGMAQGLAAGVNEIGTRLAGVETAQGATLVAIGALGARLAALDDKIERLLAITAAGSPESRELAAEMSADLRELAEHEANGTHLPALDVPSAGPQDVRA